MNNLVTILGLRERLQEEGNTNKQIEQKHLGRRGQGQQFCNEVEKRGRARHIDRGLSDRSGGPGQRFIDWI